MDTTDQQIEMNSKPKKSFPCQKCDKVYTYKGDLIKHAKTVKLTNVNNVIKVFPRQSRVISHAKMALKS